MFQRLENSTVRMKFHASPTSEATIRTLITTLTIAADRNSRPTRRSLRSRAGGPTSVKDSDWVVIPV